MASSWSCSDGHTHELNNGVKDSRSAQGEGRECVTSGDRITGMTYPSAGAAVVVLREWTASTRTEAVAT